MLSTASVFKDQILDLKPTNNKLEGVTAFVDKIASFINQVQAGSGGTVGIFTLGKPAMISILMNQAPVSDNSWIINFADALEAGVLTGIITPGTVTNPAWIGSGNLDIATVPLTAVTITTIALAKVTLIAKLQNVTSKNNPPLPLAESIRDTVLTFVFICIGLGPPPTLTPIPIPFPAQ